MKFNLQSLRYYESDVIIKESSERENNLNHTIGRFKSFIPKYKHLIKQLETDFFILFIINLYYNKKLQHIYFKTSLKNNWFYIILWEGGGSPTNMVL